MKPFLRKARLIVLLTSVILLLAGCRVRTSETASSGTDPQTGAAEAQVGMGNDAGGRSADTASDPAEAAPDRDSQSRENPEASRREYDENAGAEITIGTDRSLHTEGEGDGLSQSNPDADEKANQLHADSVRAAKLTVPSESSDRIGVSPDAEEADSALRYYTVLLQDRLGTLFECKRMNVYWETPEDHRTVYRTSPEHRLILDSGCYDVSGRLTEERLRVDDGWVSRKNPDVIVKVVGRQVLGARVSNTEAARQLRSAILARPGWNAITAVREGRVLLLSEELLEAPHLRVAAMLVIAGAAYPDLFADTDPVQALEALSEEANGAAGMTSVFWLSE